MPRGRWGTGAPPHSGEEDRVREQRIADVEPGDRVEGQFLVARKELRDTRAGKKFVDLTLMDSSGKRVTARVWENAVSISEGFEAGDVVEVRGMAETYREELQLRLDQVRALPPGELDPSEFLPRSRKDVDDLERQLLEAVKSIENPHLRELALGFFRDEKFRQRFRTAPGAKALHHAYVGGLLEHTVEVVDLCQKVAEVFSELDRDILLAGAILHDIGKTQELSWGTAFDYTDEGHLLGHLALGERMMRERADEIEGFPEELKLRLSHMILSHHGTGEFGSPKVPMTAEAIALHHAEDLDAKVNMFLGQIAAAREQGRRWTERHFLLGRSLYVGEPEAEEEA
jgi:3'-5' exoribonuclease